jgi:NAD dependent epimerase/dehydratase family enzyme
MRVPALALRLALGNGLARTLTRGQRVFPRKLLGAGFLFDFPRLDDACADLLGGNRL